MWRFLAGIGSAVLLMTAGLLIWQARADKPSPIPSAPQAQAAADAPMGVADLVPPPAATERTKEQKRFSRYDKDKNGAVAQSEYLAARRKNFDKLDLDHDGKLSFNEYAAKAVVKFAAADRDRNGALNATEFATTRVFRKAKPRVKCAPSLRAPSPAEEAPPSEEG